MRNTCDECTRSNGPHYRGRCDHARPIPARPARPTPRSARPRYVYDLVWSPTGQIIGSVIATTPRAAIQLAPPPYRKYLGELYAQVLGPAPDHVTRRKADECKEDHA